MPFDGPFQVSCAVALVGPLLQKEISTIRGHPEEKLPLGGIQDALLHLTQLDIQHFLELFTPQRVENNHFVEAVHKFGREFPSRRFHGCALHFFVQASDGLVLRLNKAMPPSMSSAISPPPKLEVRKITVCERSTFRLSPKVSVALSSIPSSICHSASL